MRSMSLAVATATIILLSPVNASAQQAGTTDTTVTTGESDRDNDGFPWGLLGLAGLAGLLPRKRNDTVHPERTTSRP